MCWRSVIKYKHELFNSYDLVDCVLSENPEQVKSRILNELQDWDESFRAVVEATPVEQIKEHPICDRLPLTRWSQGRVTLLGDAAHPMAPALGQGANCTFEDAYELQACFCQESNLEAALIRYEQRRIERTQVIQQHSALGEMRYYETNAQTLAKQIQERSQIANNDDFQNWLYSYKPY